MSRLHIGHTRLETFFKLKQEEQTHCLACHTPYTVKHFLIESKNVVLVSQVLNFIVKEEQPQSLACHTLHLLHNE